MFKRETINEDGSRELFETDSEADFIRDCLTSLLNDFGVQGGAVLVQELSEGWLRIEVRCDYHCMSQGSAIDLETEFLATIGGGKGWYDCRDSGESPDRKVHWWVTRHKSGPYI
jgi:hypothetical protein